MTTTIYKARIVECEAFQVRLATGQKPHQWLREKPEWFITAYETGKAFITNTDADNRYITIESIRGGSLKAKETMWVCRNKEKVIFVMSDEEFRGAFHVDEPSFKLIKLFSFFSFFYLTKNQ